MRSDLHQVLKARVNVDCDTNECEQLRQEITELKAALRQVELENEETQPSKRSLRVIWWNQTLK